MFQVGSAVQKPPDGVRGGQGQRQALGQKVGWWQLGSREAGGSWARLTRAETGQGDTENFKTRTL